MTASGDKCRHGLGPGCSDCDLDPQPLPSSRKRPVLFKAEKQAMRKRAEEVLPTIAVGDAGVFELPSEQPIRGSLYQVITSVAVNVFGRGNFRTETQFPNVAVIRKAEGKKAP